MEITLDQLDFDLPASAIAKEPTQKRSACRLLCANLKDKSLSHHQFKDLGQFLKQGDLLIFNDSKVIAARLYGHKATGGKIEMLIERVCDAHCAQVFIKASKAPKPGAMLHVHDYVFELVKE